MKLIAPLARIACAALLSTVAITAMAQGAASPAKKELVQKVLTLQQPSFDALARGLAEQSIAPLVQQLGAVLQNRVPPEQREATARDVQAEIKKYGDEVVLLLRDRAAKLAPTLPKDKILLVNLSGRGDKDMHTVAERSGLQF